MFWFVCLLLFCLFVLLLLLFFEFLIKNCWFVTQIPHILGFLIEIDKFVLKIRFFLFFKFPCKFMKWDNFILEILSLKDPFLWTPLFVIFVSPNTLKNGRYIHVYFMVVPRVVKILKYKAIFFLSMCIWKVMFTTISIMFYGENQKQTNKNKNKTNKKKKKKKKKGNPKQSCCNQKRDLATWALFQKRTHSVLGHGKSKQFPSWFN